MKTCNRQMRVAGFELLEQEYAPGYRSARHDHPAAELCVVLEGALTESVEHGTTLACTAGAASFKPAGAYHRVASGSAGARCLVVTLPAARMDDATASGGALRKPVLFLPGAVAALGARLRRELAAGDACAPLAAEGIALELLAAAVRHEPTRASAVAPRWVRAVRDRLHEEASPSGGAPPPLGELAATAGVTPTCLAQAFRRAYGTSVGAYVRALRLSHARMLLIGEERPLSDIALTCGFYDQSHFTRLFKRETGVTPARYRREQRSV